MNETDLTNYIESGKVLKSLRDKGATLIKAGSKVVDVLDKIEELTEQAGVIPAFPAQISLNHTAAHFCPTENDPTEFKKGDVAKLDMGVHIEGCVTDSAVTVDLGNNAALLKASQDALNNAIKKVQIGIEVRDIGKEIYKTITEQGFKPIKNLSGHGVGKYIIHGPPSIPNFDNADNTELEPDMVIAIEPFATDGAGMVEQGDKAEIFQAISRKPVRSIITRKVLNEIIKYNSLPFTTRWLTKKFSEPQVRLALKDLKMNGIIVEHPPLNDRNKGMVSQFEHTIIVDEDPLVLTK
ncbi:type II methionyl aminopeptidase [Candidatus Woesearchaeota archaeon]|jgi:methionyl aminopeptidase|nr:type II methionyl aminopeptidase [Candidatus Woesearchaeota archaeon]MBT3538172.1 type II methionyl aminopeptidase [Candidatus Woesearchaeota archaeon]MBT4697469.1 type II methionyl aminopeptidase [Candidatus Woesearchaeota archaeon]MBT4716887.1 type II methionyl aminopeptidase [Candidatus Woesearchaeota archaeon]MBT7105841.1 type II methionyl aminopeptidase [Candidatus Woesearchaeota archaeon]